MDLTRLAVLAEWLGGIEALAAELSVDANLIRRALLGETLTRKERALLNKALSEWDIQEEVNESNDQIDLDYIDDLTDSLDEYLQPRVIPDQRFYPAIRIAYAEGRITEEDLIINDAATVAPLDIFFELTAWQADKLLEWLEQGNELSEALDLYIEDRIAGRGLFRDVEDSVFWAWFRETFYK